MEKILNLALETFEHLAGLGTGEVHDKIKSNISAIVQEAESLSNAFKLAVASAPKNAATSPAPTPPDDGQPKPTPVDDKCVCAKCGQICLPNSPDNCRC